MTEDERHHGMIGAVASIGEKALGVIPPALVVLVSLNVAWIGFDAWLEISQNASRERVLSTIVAGCFGKDKP